MMNLKEATDFILFENKNRLPQLWLDLGSGEGLFSLALANNLPAGSRIVAVDKDENALRKVPSTAGDVVIQTIAADFVHEVLDIKEVDGILLANSLHYVKDKETFLKKLISLMKTTGVFLIVEYDRKTSNRWVPYPLTIDDAKALFKGFDYFSFQVLNKRPSMFGGFEMYAAIIANGER